jgi:hypothetical protein
MKRSFWDDLDDFIDTIGHAIESGLEAIAEAAAEAAMFIIGAVETIIEITIDIIVAAYKLVEFIITGEYDDSWTLGLRLMPSTDSMTDTPWGEGVQLVDYKPGESDKGFSHSKEVLESIRNDLIGEPDPEPGIQVYCIDCGIDGSVTVSVHLEIHPFSGIGKGSVSVEGHMYMGLYVGIDAFAEAEQTATKEIIKRGLPGWSIPGIISIGPELSLSVEAGVKVEAEGQIFAGASLTWPNFTATFDIAHPSQSTKDGWDPIFDRKLNVHGEVTASAHLGLPIKLFFGVDVFDGTFTLGAGLVNMPEIVAKATFEAAADTTAQTPTIGNDECIGVSFDVSLTNDLKFEMDPGGSWEIASWPGPTLASVCLGDEVKSDEEGDSPDQPKPTGGPGLEGNITCPDADGRIYKDPAGNRFSISCFNSTSKSLWHIGFNVFDNFNQCVEWCAKDKRCAGVSWYEISPLMAEAGLAVFPIWGTNADGKIFNCAMDNNRPPTALVADGHWSATPVLYQENLAENVTCPTYNNNIYAGHGHSWRIHCSGDMPWYGGGPGTGPLRQLQDCIDFCASSPDCSGALWDPVKGDCQTGTSNPDKRAPDDTTGPRHAVELLNPHGIVSVMYGKLDVTKYAIANWATGSRIVIDSQALWRWAPAEEQKYIDDDATMYRKFLYRPIFMLYTYGGSMKSWVGGDWMDTLTIYPPGVPGGAWTPGVAYVPGTPSTNLTFAVDPVPLDRPLAVDWVRIVEVCYALSQQRLPSQWAALYKSAQGYRVSVGEDPALFPNNWPTAPWDVKWMVVWYKDTRISEDGPLYAVAARDGEYLNLMYPSGRFQKREDTLDAVPRRSIGAPSRAVTLRATNDTGVAVTNSTTSGTKPTGSGGSSNDAAHKTLTFGTATILDTSGALALYAGINGNLFMAAASGTGAQNLSVLTNNTTLTAVIFSGDGTAATDRPALFVGGDSADRVLHYFPDELAALGASRLRVSTRDKLPLTSRLAGLVPVHTQQQQGMVLAFDASSSITPPPAAVGRKPLYLVLCNIADQINRVFLVQNTSAAALEASFQATNREFILTGGKASNCGPLPLTVSVEQAGPDMSPPGWLSNS